MMIRTLGDEAANQFDEPLAALEAAVADGTISAEEQLLVLVAVEQLRAMRPVLEELALTLRAMNQLSRVGVSRFPNYEMGRSITELRTYKEQQRREQEDAAGLLRFGAKKKAPATGTGDAA